MLVSSSAQTQPTILSWRWCIICTLNRSILPVVVHSVNNGGVFLSSLKMENVLIMETQMLAVHTFPLVTALRKKGSSFPANLASSSYFSRPEKTKLQTIEQTLKKKTLAAFSTSLSSFKESDLTNPFIRLSTKCQPSLTSGVLHRVRHDLVSSARSSHGKAPLGDLPKIIHNVQRYS